MRDLIIQCSTKSEKIAAIALLSAYGFTYDGEDMKAEIRRNDEDFFDMEYPHILLEFSAGASTEKDIINFVNDEYEDDDAVTYEWDYNLSMILKHLNSPPKEDLSMWITNDYEANITEEGIEVGCQTIKFEVFEELVELVKQYKEQ
jgi:hypothetical protein